MEAVEKCRGRAYSPAHPACGYKKQGAYSVGFFFYLVARVKIQRKGNHSETQQDVGKRRSGEDKVSNDKKITSTAPSSRNRGSTKLTLSVYDIYLRNVIAFSFYK